MRKLFTRKKEPYLRYHIDFLGSYTTRPSITNNMSHGVLRLLRYRYNLRKRTRMSSDLASFGYRRGFVSKYLYRTDINRPQLRLRRYKGWFVSRRLVKFFYLTLKYVQFRRIGRSVVRREGSWSSNLALAIECRIITFLYRLQVSPDIFELKQLVEVGVALVLDEAFPMYGGMDLCSFAYMPRNCNYLVPMYALVVVISDWRKKLLTDFHARLLSNRVFFNVPRFMIVSYQFFMGFIWRHPDYPGDFAYPFLRRSVPFKPGFVLDIYRGMDISYL